MTTYGFYTLQSKPPGEKDEKWILDARWSTNNVRAEPEDGGVNHSLSEVAAKMQ